MNDAPPIHVDHLNWSVDFDIDFEGYFLFKHHDGPTYRDAITEHKIPAEVVKTLMTELLRRRRIRESERMGPVELGITDARYKSRY